MTDIVTWFVVSDGFTAPTSKDEKILEFETWTGEQRRKAQSNTKANVTLQC